MADQRETNGGRTRLSPKWMSSAVAGGCALMMLAGLACSDTAKHRWLTFFFDGVPPLESPTTPQPEPDEPLQPLVAEEVKPPQRLFAHTPYREGRCGGCHDITSGELVRPLGEGLCLTCHGDLVRSRKYLHGPVAVEDCTACHHYHTAPFAQLLHVDPVATCHKCHDAADLQNDDYHADIAGKSCVECHDPHGGADRFFLKRSAP